MEKSEEIKQSWTGQKTWLSVSEQFLAAMTKDFFSKENWALNSVYTQFSDFPKIDHFYDEGSFI